MIRLKSSKRRKKDKKGPAVFSRPVIIIVKKKQKVFLHADENSVITILKTGGRPITREKIDHVKTPENDDVLEKCLESFPVTNSYVEFCNALIRLNAKTEKNIVLVFYKERITVLFSEYSYVMKHLVTFQPENKKMYDFLKKHFNPNLSTSVSKISYAFRVSTVHSNFAWDLPPSIFEVFLAAIECETEGTPFYNKFQIKKHNGKMRTIYAPDERIKSALRKVNKILQIAYDDRNSDFQVAYKAGKSIKDNASPHRNNKYIMKVDISDFFPSCKKDMVKKYIEFLFKGKNTHPDLIERFLNIITVDDGLFIGSPVSGTLANVIISGAVNHIHNICNKYDITFTVYADDMCFSSVKYLSKEFVESIFKLAFEEYNLDTLKINPEKTHGGTGTNRHITGISFNQTSQTVCRRSKYRELRAVLHSLSQGKEVPQPLQSIRGKIAFMMMVDESEKIFNLLVKYREVVEANHLYKFKEAL